MEILNTVKLFREFILFKYGSENTAKNYCQAVSLFLNHFKDRAEPKAVNADEIIQYLLKFENLHTRRNAHSAIKLFYKHKSKNGFSNKFRYIPYPEKQETLPNPITKNEFVQILSVCENLKHKCILMLAFDCGLRVSEVINLKIEHLDFHKMQVRVVQSKGRVDRLLKMTSILSNFLTQYIEKDCPKEYVFNGQFSIKYSTRSCQQLLKNYAKKSGITRNVKFHENRHGFAQSLLENGTGLERIQDLLGHKSSKTTRIYARMNNVVIQQTESPLEQIMRENSSSILLNNQKTIQK